MIDNNNVVYADDVLIPYDIYDRVLSVDACLHPVLDFSPDILCGGVHRHGGNPSEKSEFDKSYDYLLYPQIGNDWS